MMQKALDISEPAGLLMTAEIAHTYLTEIYNDQAELELTMLHGEKALQLARQTGQANRELFDIVLYCSLQFSQGQIMKCESLIERGRYLAQISNTLGPAALGLRCAEAYFAIGKRDFGQALNILEDTRSQALKVQNINWLVQIIGLMFEIRLELKEYTKAEQLLLETQPLLEQEGSFMLHYSLARIYSNQGKIEQAHAMLEKARSKIGQVPSISEQVSLIFLDAIVAGNEQRWDEAWQLFDQAYKIAAERGMLWFRCTICLLRADLYIRRNEPGDKALARQQLAEVADFYRKNELSAWVKYVEGRMGETE
jgi:tetratricopeptide (TPR) repeat protein